MVHASIRRTLDERWLQTSPLRLGRVPGGLGTPVRYVLVHDDSVLLLRLDLYGSDEETYAFEAARPWAEWIAVGWGHRLFLVALRGEAPQTVDLGAYFGSMVDMGDSLVVASAERLLCLDVTGRVAWRTEVVGLDGVLVHGFDESWIDGEGEWDPPGGWRPFRVERRTGRVVWTDP